MELTTSEIMALPKHAFAMPSLAAKYESYIGQEIYKTRPKPEKHSGQFNGLFAQNAGKKGGDTEGTKRRRVSDQRRREICTRSDYFTAEDLVEVYGISISTIRKDLTALYQCGLVTRNKIDTTGRYANFFYEYRGAIDVD